MEIVVLVAYRLKYGGPFAGGAELWGFVAALTFGGAGGWRRDGEIAFGEEVLE